MSMTINEISPAALRRDVRSALKQAERALLSGDLEQAEKWWGKAKERGWTAVAWQAFTNGLKEGRRAKR